MNFCSPLDHRWQTMKGPHDRMECMDCGIEIAGWLVRDMLREPRQYTSALRQAERDWYIKELES